MKNKFHENEFLIGALAIIIIILLFAFEFGVFASAIWLICWGFSLSFNIKMTFGLWVLLELILWLMKGINNDKSSGIKK